MGGFWISGASLPTPSPGGLRPPHALTSVCTMAGLWVRSIFTVWKMSTTPSYRMRSSTMLSVMKTPVLPTPALLGRAQAFGGGFREPHLTARYIRDRENPNLRACVKPH